MASRVNVKFVALLSTVLVIAAAGTGFLAYKVVFKTPEELARRGDAKLAEGEFKAAELLYSKAVNKDPYNSVYLLKWREALEKWIPETDRELQTEFETTYRSLLSQLARSDNMSHTDFQLQYLGLLERWARSQGFSRSLNELIAGEADTFIDYLESANPEDPALPSLKRTRAMSWARIALQGLALTPEQRDQTEQDFAAVLEADPADYQALMYHTAMQRAAAEKAEAAGRITETNRVRGQVESTLEAFVQANGAESIPGTMAGAVRVQDELRARSRALLDELGANAIPRIEALRDEYHQFTIEAAQRIAAADPEEQTLEAVNGLYALESQTNRENDFSATLPVLEAMLRRNPDDLRIAMRYADVLSARREYGEAIEVWESVIDSDPLPLGIEGYERISARASAASSIADSALRARAADPEGPEAARWLETARSARDTLSQLISEQSPAVLFLDARLALAEENLSTAQALLTQHNQLTGNRHLESLWMAAQVAQALNQPGNARDALRAILAVSPSDATAKVALAEVEISLNRPDAALEYLRDAQKSRPDDTRIANRIDQIMTLIDPSLADDPIERAVLEAQRLAMGSESEIADPAAALARLDRAITELGPDPKLYYAKTATQLRMDDPAGAAATYATAREAFPDDEQLLRLKTVVEAGQATVEQKVEMVRGMDRPEMAKLFEIYRIYLEAGRRAEATATLAEAQAIEPNHPALIELQFGEAFNAGDVQRARAVAQRAQAANTDEIDGLTYRARVLMLEDKNEEALAALTQCTQRKPNNAGIWRLLGDLQVQMGQTGDALGSYQRALNIRPDDVPTILAYCSALASLNRLPEALDLARRSEASARHNPRFMEILLSLESQVGDKQSARDRREKLLAAQPDNMANRHSLIDLYISLGQRDQAMGLLNQTREQFGQSDALVQLEARWYAEGNELEQARRVFAAHIAQSPPDQRVDRYTALAQFMFTRGQSRPGLIALRQAVAAQAPGEHEVEVMLASALMRYGRSSEAYEVIDELLAQGLPDPEHQLKLQAVEALIAVDRLSDAETMLAKVPNQDSNLVAVLLRSRLQLKRGNGRSARATLDEAVRRWPEDFRVWMLRAEAEAEVPELLPDALADLEQAIELQPGLAEAHRRRAEILDELDRDDEAIQAAWDAIRLDPTNEELRGILLMALVRRGQTTQAIQMSQEWFNLRPRDTGLRSRVAELFVMSGMRDAAIQTYQEALSIDQQPQLLLRLVDLLLGQQPPRLSDAERALANAGTLVAGDPALLLARARVLALTNRVEGARNDCAASFRLTPKRADAMTYWYTTLRGVFEDQQQAMVFLRGLAAQPDAAEWASMFAARVLAGSPETLTTGITELQGVISRTRNPEVRYAGLRALAGNQYARGLHEEAITAWKQGLELKPNDWQLLNNIAYALATDVGRPEEALPYAERAGMIASDNPEVLDTLGTTYLALDRPREAIPPLEAAVQETRGTTQAVRYMIRLGQARLASGDQRGAQDLVSQIEPLLDQGRELDDQYRTMLTELRQAVAGE